MPNIAQATLDKIEAYLEADQGNRYRALLQRTLPPIEDAYRQEQDNGHRSHIGASLLGRKCSREIWYSWRWATRPVFTGRMLRLFNRGHLEEGRMVALLLMIGCQVHQFTEDGKQFRISGGDGHYGGGLDAVIVGLPEFPGEPLLGEFKTHNDKSFKKLKEDGLYSAKFEHYVQMQQYMGHYQLKHGLYVATNKNDDDIYAEIVDYNLDCHTQAVKRAIRIRNSGEAPARISRNPGWYECKFCNHHAVCHMNAAPDVNCRTCVHSRPIHDGQWACHKHGIAITKDLQLTGCVDYTVHPGISANP